MVECIYICLRQHFFSFLRRCAAYSDCSSCPLAIEALWETRKIPNYLCYALITAVQLLSFFLFLLPFFFFKKKKKNYLRKKYNSILDFSGQVLLVLQFSANVWCMNIGSLPPLGWISGDSFPPSPSRGTAPPS
jgi:hypothetical protein